MADIQIPSGATVVVSSSGNVAAASAIATLASPADNKKNYVTGFMITSAGATAGVAVVGTITGLLGGTISFVYSAPTGAAVGSTPYILSFPIPVPAATGATAIVLTLPSLGLGNTNAAVTLFGFTL